MDVGPMAAVAVAVDDGIATIGAGARLGAVYDALDAHGLAVPAGCGPTRRRPRPSRSTMPAARRAPAGRAAPGR